MCLGTGVSLLNPIEEVIEHLPRIGPEQQCRLAQGHDACRVPIRPRACASHAADFLEQLLRLTRQAVLLVHLAGG